MNKILLFKPLLLAVGTITPSLVTLYITKRLLQGFKLSRVINTTLFQVRVYRSLYPENKIIGYKTRWDGRFSRKDRATHALKITGSVPLSTFRIPISHNMRVVRLTNGICSIKFSIAFGKSTKQSKKFFRKFKYYYSTLYYFKKIKHFKVLKYSTEALAEVLMALFMFLKKTPQKSLKTINLSLKQKKINFKLLKNLKQKLQIYIHKKNKFIYEKNLIYKKSKQKLKNFEPNLKIKKIILYFTNLYNFFYLNKKNLKTEFKSLIFFKKYYPKIYNKLKLENLKSTDFAQKLSTIIKNNKITKEFSKGLIKIRKYNKLENTLLKKNLLKTFFLMKNLKKKHNKIFFKNINLNYKINKFLDQKQKLNKLNNSDAINKRFQLVLKNYKKRFSNNLNKNNKKIKSNKKVIKKKYIKKKFIIKTPKNLIKKTYKFFAIKNLLKRNKIQLSIKNNFAKNLVKKQIKYLFKKHKRLMRLKPKLRYHYINQYLILNYFTYAWRYKDLVKYFLIYYNQYYFKKYKKLLPKISSNTFEIKKLKSKNILKIKKINYFLNSIKSKKFIKKKKKTHNKNKTFIKIKNKINRKSIKLKMKNKKLKFFIKNIFNKSIETLLINSSSKKYIKKSYNLKNSEVIKLFNKKKFKIKFLRNFKRKLQNIPILFNGFNTSSGFLKQNKNINNLIHYYYRYFLKLLRIIHKNSDISKILEQASLKIKLFQGNNFIFKLLFFNNLKINKCLKHFKFHIFFSHKNIFLFLFFVKKMKI